LWTPSGTAIQWVLLTEISRYINWYDLKYCIARESSLRFKRFISHRKDIWFRSCKIHSGRTCNHSLWNTWLCCTWNFGRKGLRNGGRLLECWCHSLHSVIFLNVLINI
jgi:hypothetical protein